VITQEGLWACRADKEERERKEVLLSRARADATAKAKEARKGAKATAPEERGVEWLEAATELLRTSLLELRDRLQHRRLTQDR
jgi:creatinine amidohydrolase/Fe(II)-dependent formamide hydrolase-like protein